MPMFWKCWKKSHSLQICRKKWFCLIWDFLLKFSVYLLRICDYSSIFEAQFGYFFFSKLVMVRTFLSQMLVCGWVKRWSSYNHQISISRHFHTHRPTHMLRNARFNVIYWILFDISLTLNNLQLKIFIGQLTLNRWAPSNFTEIS